MKILVTGAGGFIGSHLTEALLRRGHSVRALVRYNSQGRTGLLEDLGKAAGSGLEIFPGDVTDPGRVRQAVEGCSVVTHLAALIGIPYSYHAPASYTSVNVVGTQNILEASRQAGVERVIVTSTSEVYGTARESPMTERHPLQAQSPYAASKIAADKLAEAYYHSYGLPAVILRPFNTYGPRQSARAVIPTIIAQALSGQKQIRLGNLNPRRDLTFVEDTARAFVLAAEAPGIEGKTLHFGSGEAISIGDLAAQCLRLLNCPAQVVGDPERKRPSGSEVELLQCDASLARQVLGWKPEVTLEEGLKRTIQYLERHLDQYRPEQYML
jgi:dTDP-glucose 4,6-dehydratase